MKRTTFSSLSCFCLVTLVLSSANSQTRLEKSGGIDVPVKPNPKQIDLTLPIVASPVPAFKYELLPSVKELKPGNAALYYSQAINIRPTGKTLEERKKQSDTIEAWQGIPYNQIPKAEVIEFIKPYREVFEKLEQAMNCKDCDWQQKYDLNWISSNLENVQKFRELAVYLKLKIKLEMAEGRYENAFKTIQCGLVMAKHVGESGAMINALVGHALTAIFLEQLEAYLASPGSPNLYWAFTSTPISLIDFRKVYASEQQVNLSFYPDLSELQKGIVSEEVANKAIENCMNMRNQMNLEVSSFEKAAFSANMLLLGKGAKKDLESRGWKKEQLEKMPAAQAVILRGVSVYQELFDEQLKFFYLPYNSLLDEEERFKTRLDDVKRKYSTDVFIHVTALVFPTISKLREAFGRMDRRFAILRASEAVRLFAHENNGTIPENLSDIKRIVVPNDPFSNQPFIYEKTKEGYRLEGPAPNKQMPNPSNAIILNVTIKK